MLVPWGQVSIVSHFYQTYFGFSGSDLNLDCGLRDHGVRISNDTVQPCDTTQVRLDSDFGIKNTTVQVYENSHNSRSDRWIKVIFYVDAPNMSFYLGFKFQVNRSSGRHHNTVRILLFTSI